MVRLLTVRSCPEITPGICKGYWIFFFKFIELYSHVHNSRIFSTLEACLEPLFDLFVQAVMGFSLVEMPIRIS